MNFNKLVEVDRVINASSYRYRCDTCGVVMGYKGTCYECKEKSKSEIKAGVIVQLVPFENQPEKARIFLVNEAEYDRYSYNTITLKTALDMEGRGLIQQVFKPIFTA
jgi:hypothetical protein